MKKFALILALAFAGLTLMADPVTKNDADEWSWVEHNTWAICDYAEVYDYAGTITSPYDGYYVMTKNCTITVSSFGWADADNAYTGFKLLTAAPDNPLNTPTNSPDVKFTVQENTARTNAEIIVIGTNGSATYDLKAGTMIALQSKDNSMEQIDQAYGRISVSRPDLPAAQALITNTWETSADGKTFTWYADSTKSKGFVYSISGNPLPGPVTSLLLAALVAGGLFMAQRKGKFALAR